MRRFRRRTNGPSSMLPTKAKAEYTRQSQCSGSTRSRNHNPRRRKKNAYNFRVHASSTASGSALSSHARASHNPSTIRPPKRRDRNGAYPIDPIQVQVVREVP
jgi:hypothetical protein